MLVGAVHNDKGSFNIKAGSTNKATINFNVLKKYLYSGNN